MSILAYILFLSFSVFSDEESWILVKKTDDFEVYSRKLDQEEFKEIKIVGKIKCKMSEFVLAIEDVEAQKDWVIRTIDAIELEKLDAGEFYYYVSTDLPFPIKDRDLVVHYKRSQDPETHVVNTRSEAAPDRIEEKIDFVRIPVFDSYYKLSPEADGWIRMDYYMKVNPGGALPPWLVNLAAAKGPSDTINSLFDLIYSGRYKGQKAQGIID